MKTKIKIWLIPLFMILSLVVMMVMPTTALAATDRVMLGTTESFAILAGTTITNTGSSVITGDIGLHPGSEITGFPPGTVSGATHTTDAVALQAKNDLITAYNDAAGRTPTVTYSATDNQLGGLTLTSGVYAFGGATTANLVGDLTLDAEGDPEAVFIFQASSTLITASGSRVILTNGAQFCRVFWQVGSSATLGSGSTFVGHIFAMQSISLNDSAQVQGQLLAREAAVTLINNIITNGPCTATLHVINNVVNDDGRTAVASDFSIHVTASGVDVGGSPAGGAASPGTSYSLQPGTYVVSEGAHPGYDISYSGDSTTGTITLASFDSKTITITNNDTDSSTGIGTYTNSNTANNPRTGEYTPDYSWIIVLVVGICGLLIFSGVFLYLRRNATGV